MTKQKQYNHRTVIIPKTHLVRLSKEYSAPEVQRHEWQPIWQASRVAWFWRHHQCYNNLQHMITVIQSV